MTYFVIRASLAYPIAPFNEEKELAVIKQAEEMAEDHRPESGKLERKKSGLEAQTIPKVTATKHNQSLVKSDNLVLNPDDAIFERMIIVLPFKAPEMVK